MSYPPQYVAPVFMSVSINSALPTSLESFPDYYITHLTSDVSNNICARHHRDITSHYKILLVLPSFANVQSLFSLLIHKNSTYSWPCEKQRSDLVCHHPLMISKHFDTSNQILYLILFGCLSFKTKLHLVVRLLIYNFEKCKVTSLSLLLFGPLWCPIVVPIR